MSTKNVTTSTNQYDPKSMGTYQSLQGPATQQLGQQITNPNANPLMNRLRATGQQASAGFFRGPQSFTGSNNAAFQRAGMSMGGQQNNSLLMGGAQMRNQSLMAAMNYRPLQTGGKQVESTSGLGTWLTPLIGMGMAGAETLIGMKKGLISGSPQGTPGGDPTAANAMSNTMNFSQPTSSFNGSDFNNLPMNSNQVWGLS